MVIVSIAGVSTIEGDRKHGEDEIEMFWKQ